VAVPFFSVVIGALNAAATLPATIAALHEQTFTDWEAIVVDDGSADDTPGIVRRYAGADPRIRLLHASSRGVSAARNDGIAAAAGAWLLFLDADDTIFPDALDAWHRAIEAEADVDAWCGGWVRVAPGGDVVTHEQWPITPDMFPVLARLSAFPIHSCVVRRSIVFRSGGFDVGYITCEDWDLWQRLARAGARFGTIASDVARYHMRPRSASLAARQMLVDGLRVITTGHSAAPRPRFASDICAGRRGCCSVTAPTRDRSSISWQANGRPTSIPASSLTQSSDRRPSDAAPVLLPGATSGRQSRRSFPGSSGHSRSEPAPGCWRDACSWLSHDRSSSTFPKRHR